MLPKQRSFPIFESFRFGVQGSSFRPTISATTERQGNYSTSDTQGSLCTVLESDAGILICCSRKPASFACLISKFSRWLGFPEFPGLRVHLIGAADSQNSNNRNERNIARIWINEKIPLFLISEGKSSLKFFQIHQLCKLFSSLMNPTVASFTFKYRAFSNYRFEDWSVVAKSSRATHFGDKQFIYTQRLQS